jgi:hypothetical protein
LHFVVPKPPNAPKAKSAARSAQGAERTTRSTSPPARELRDRWLEKVNEEPGAADVGSANTMWPARWQQAGPDVNKALPPIAA